MGNDSIAGDRKLTWAMGERGQEILAFRHDVIGPTIFAMGCSDSCFDGLVLITAQHFSATGSEMITMRALDVHAADLIESLNRLELVPF
jgi:hypothetical protein